MENLQVQSQLSIKFGLPKPPISRVSKSRYLVWKESKRSLPADHHNDHLRHPGFKDHVNLWFQNLKVKVSCIKKHKKYGPKCTRHVQDWLRNYWWTMGLMKMEGKSKALHQVPSPAWLRRSPHATVKWPWMCFNFRREQLVLLWVTSPCFMLFPHHLGSKHESTSALIAMHSETFYLASVCVVSYLYDMEWTAWRHAAVIH